jgi:hypothetical protein
MFYPGVYDPNNTAAPACHAIGAEKGAMRASPKSVTIPINPNGETGDCLTCPMNQFRSAATGGGKACKNLRRLMMVEVGTFDRDGNFQMFDETKLKYEELKMIRTTVTSEKLLTAYIHQIAKMANPKPLDCMVTQIRLVDPPEGQRQPFDMEFKPLMQLNFQLYTLLQEKKEKAQRLVEFEFEAKPQEEEFETSTKPKRYEVAHATN